MSTNTIVSATSASSHPPHDQHAEQAVVGGLLLNADVIPDVLAAMKIADLYEPRHQAIATAAVELRDAGQPVDAITVSSELTKRGELDRVGGAPYLHTLIATVPTAENAAYYAATVAEKAQHRVFGETSTRLQQVYSDAEVRERVDLVELLTTARDTVDAGLEAMSSGRESHPQRGIAQQVIDHAIDVRDGHVEPGISTGFADLDDVLGGGLSGGQLMTIAARSGAGKSTLATDIARAAAIRQHQHVTIASYEMTRSEVWQRVLCAESRVRLSDLRAGRLDDLTLARLSRTAANLADTGDDSDTSSEDRLHVIDTSPSLAELMAIAQQQHRQGRLDMLIVDYLQIAPIDDSAASSSATRDRLLGMATQRLKNLAQRLGIPVIVLSQLNRAVDSRSDPRPRLHDLRESGSIENDSDIVLLIHRPDMINADDPRAGEADFMIAKQRGGPTSTIAVAEQLHYSRFADLAAE